MERLDKELVIRNLVETRTKAQELIEKGAVLVNGVSQTKVSYKVNDQDVILIQENEILKYVSRGGFKLEKALKVFNYDVADKVVMDIGSSTGGFTDCCLQNGAKKVISIDVGKDVMHSSLRGDRRIDLHENTNIKDLTSGYFKDIDLIVVDVSFVSLEKIIEKVSSENIKVDMICLIKPQFECGREIAKKYHGIIKSKTVHKDVIKNVIKYFNKEYFYMQSLDFSPIKGGDGNIEYLSFFTNKIENNIDIDIEKVVNSAFTINA